MTGYYILSLKHSHKHQGFLSWWGPNDSGYVARLKNAGVYTEEKDERKAGN
jgi:hypothetical protein